MMVYVFSYGRKGAILKFEGGGSGGDSKISIVHQPFHPWFTIFSASFPFPSSHLLSFRLIIQSTRTAPSLLSAMTTPPHSPCFQCIALPASSGYYRLRAHNHLTVAPTPSASSFSRLNRIGGGDGWGGQARGEEVQV